MYAAMSQSCNTGHLMQNVMTAPFTMYLPRQTITASMYDRNIQNNKDDSANEALGHHSILLLRNTRPIKVLWKKKRDMV